MPNPESWGSKILELAEFWALPNKFFLCPCYQTHHLHILIE